ncbi:MAG: hypothetical protein PHW62_00860 [Candidatus Ratteibacteria bacterium]|nr:hypothetical protein [Candidatus Ratteibacteria bacterium]
MNLELFKEKCIAREKEQSKKIEEFKSLKSLQMRYDDQCYRPKTRFSWRKLRIDKLCPVCGEMLVKETVAAEINMDGDINKHNIYRCPCEYVYVVTEP